MKKVVSIALLLLAAAAVFIVLKRQHTDAPSPADDEHETYKDETLGISVQFPTGWRVDPSYEYSLLGPKEPTIPGVKIFVPEVYLEGTNLSGDTGISVELMPGMPTCTAYPFLIQPDGVSEVTAGGRAYSLGTMTGAAAGNRYEEQVFAIADSEPCIGIRYFIHFSAIENFKDGVVREFDRETLVHDFDMVRDSVRSQK